MEDGGDSYLNKQWWKGPLHPSCRFRFDLDGRPLRIAATTRCAPLLEMRLECLPPGGRRLALGEGRRVRAWSCSAGLHRSAPAPLARRTARRRRALPLLPRRLPACARAQAHTY